MMRMVVGLGNPGKRYEATRHNIGFFVLDFLSNSLGINFNKTKKSALTTEFNYEGQRSLLIKPQTYMNLSGRSVGAVSRYYKIMPENILVVHDDLDIGLGKIKIKPGGGPGGHKGLKSIINSLGTSEFNRLKIGIGRPLDYIDPVEYVLGTISDEEWEVLKEILPQAVKAADSFLKGNEINKIMSIYNI